MVCCFANPSSAPARMPPFQLAEFHPALTHHPIQSSCMDCSTSARGRRTGPSPLQAARVTSRTLSNPNRRRRLTAGAANSVSSARHFVPMRAEPMKISRSECGDPVCSPDPASLLRLSLFTCTAPPTSQEGRLWPSRRRGIISGRFRERKLVGSGGYSKCFFAAVFPQAMPAAHARFRGRFVAGSARGTP